jgi:3-oxocholest-4-en-26-oyl-CoA dehydrogenase alpha subunit
VNFELDEDQQAWRDEVRAFLRENVTPELIRERQDRGYEHAGGELARFRQKVGDKGWFGLNWPKEYGGLGLGAIYQHILVSEFEYWGAPGPNLTVTSVAPMIMRYGTQQNREEFLPPIARGELTVAVGYSEPNAGTDLASLKTRADLDGDEWVINGSKIWNSLAHMASHEWLCVRTDPEAPKHRGISVIMVPIDLPGIEVRPLIAWDDFRTNETFFTDVRVPRTNLIGEVNRGWQYITGALDLERGALTNAGDLRRAVDDLIAVARITLADGSRPLDDADVRRKIAQLDADVEVAVLMGLEASSLLESGQIPTITVTAEKIFSSELRQRIADVGTQMLGMQGILSRSDREAVAGGGFEKLYRSAPLMRFGAGANEVLRDVIAQRGHAMPGYGR